MNTTIRIILNETSHPGNIGSAARAMKTMGFIQLVLVNPKRFPDTSATELAAGAKDILQHALVTESLEEAIADSQIVIGTSTRGRAIDLPFLTPKECAERCSKEWNNCSVAIVFGCEQSGLSNTDLLQCHYHLSIPANEVYPVLNLAQAVQIVCYECRMAFIQQATNETFTEKKRPAKPEHQLATVKQVQRFYQQLEETLIDLEFLNPRSPRRLMPRLRRLFNRLQLENMEVNILRGILNAMQVLAKKSDKYSH